ncbi:MAG: hypothetical protein KZQ64_09900 [gamma proteobacterium symbiont of Bathyaustriella thionipta]|nr:hypothetical protein [gamma proteobacterium symbiont of Bathyaustriella thionipta]MCU7949227.1 hypothetical protein [gamma proteobacterium symbiont of Bathyaustriella thionipta]MCU7953684.1 hypothetical protein [gamma proteobacterium symbiont of Bathyaustriella thionipta]MCU7955815.1 hypothetical protein [gamma proteobacterium symbiont of Bathyaustriella thionipta]MCU7967289.1 hypothetical protein [gamma proteobacterium symbiont of Bathyaustriella thionipta]
MRDSIALEHADETQLKSNYLKHICTQAYAKSLHHKPGPVHLNIPFREPLLPRRFAADELNHFIQHLSQQTINNATDLLASDMQSDKSTTSISKKNLGLLVQIFATGNGLIICGRLTLQEHRDFVGLLPLLADKLNCPVLVDPLSNLRFTGTSHSHFIYNYDHSLKQARLQPSEHISQQIIPKWIIRFGQFPVSKALFQYLQALNSHTILVSSYGDYLDPVHKANTVLAISAEKFCRQLLNTSVSACSNDWITLWQQTDQQSENKIKQSVEQPVKNGHALFEGHVINSLLTHIPDKSILFSGNSMAIRDFDTFITHASTDDKQLDFFANRGTSGIDGNLSTFFGLLANHDGYGVALLGDLSFYHDMNGLLICRQLAELGYSATIIVVNNNGGGIFNYLPQQQLDNFDKLWKTEINLDFQHCAKLYGLTYSLIKSHETNAQQVLESTLSEAFYQTGIQLVEIIIDQQTSTSTH